MSLASSLEFEVPAARDVAVRTIAASDLNAALTEGWQDFRAKRGDILLAGLLYPLIGLGAAAVTQGAGLPLLFPLLAGLSLLGPLVATGFYILARRRELELESSWRHFLDIRNSASFEGVAIVGLLLIAIFGAWLAAAAIIYVAFFGMHTPASVAAFIGEILTTPQGWGLIVVGNLAGLAFAVLVLMLSVASLPMLVDKRIDAGTALRTSMRAVNANRAVMARWGLIVAALLAIGSIPVFLGLAVVLPVLGYATWHLYTRLVVRDGLPDA